MEDFWVLKNSWDMCLPKVYEGMFFLMRKLDNQCIYPQWEDKNNRQGGYWSFKVLKTKSEECWFELMIYTISEQILKNSIDFADINGISISPKKNFCILKIWNKDSTCNDKEILSSALEFLNMDEILYSAHETNIKRDVDKLKRRKDYIKRGGRVNFNRNKYNNYYKNSRK